MKFKYNVGLSAKDLYHSLKERKYLTPQKATFRELEINIDSVSAHKGAYFQLYQGNLDILIIRGFLTHEEIKRLINRTERWPQKLIVKKSFGHTFGPTLVDSQNELEKYFQQSALFNDVLNSALGFDFTSRFVNIMANLGGIEKNQVHNPMVKAGSQFASTNIKFMQPYKGSLPIHCGMQFRHLFPEYKTIENYKDPKNQLSYFTVLQQPTRGGEIQLYNLLFDNTPLFTNPQLTRNYVASVKESKFYRPQIGDMFFFNGGQIWHRITQIRGMIPRISLSAFTAPNPEGNGIIYWS